MNDEARRSLLENARKMIGKYSYDKEGARDEKGLPKTDDTAMDCSEFVHAAYQTVDKSFPYLNSHAIAGSPKFEKVDAPVAGDIVYWPQGHVAIVENPETGEFIGSQTSTGVARSNYNTNVYWRARAGRAFYRWKDAK